MNILLGCATGLALIASLAPAQETTSENWKSFKSSTGFTVKYPGDWFPKGTSTDRLMILSSSGGAEAIVIKPGQAVISVIEEEKYAKSTLSQVVDHYIRDSDVLSRRNIHNENAPTLGCSDLREIVSRESAVPPEDVPGHAPYIINTEYFCEIKTHKYVTVLRNFEGDKKQARYQQIAMRVAKSLRASRSRSISAMVPAPEKWNLVTKSRVRPGPVALDKSEGSVKGSSGTSALAA